MSDLSSDVCSSDLFSEPSFDLAEGMARLAELPLLFDPGTRWNYSMSTDVCGRLVEVMSGVPLDAFLRERVLAPLGLQETTFSAPASVVGRCSPRSRAGRDRG